MGWYWVLFMPKFYFKEWQLDVFMSPTLTLSATTTWVSWQTLCLCHAFHCILLWLNGLLVRLLKTHTTITTVVVQRPRMRRRVTAIPSVSGSPRPPAPVDVSAVIRKSQYLAMHLEQWNITDYNFLSNTHRDCIYKPGSVVQSRLERGWGSHTPWLVHWVVYTSVGPSLHW